MWSLERVARVKRARCQTQSLGRLGRHRVYGLHARGKRARCQTHVAPQSSPPCKTHAARKCVCWQTHIARLGRHICPRATLLYSLLTYGVCRHVCPRARLLYSLRRRASQTRDISETADISETSDISPPYPLHRPSPNVICGAYALGTHIRTWRHSLQAAARAYTSMPPSID
jgi:hypothetical protein